MSAAVRIRALCTALPFTGGTREWCNWPSLVRDLLSDACRAQCRICGARNHASKMFNKNTPLASQTLMPGAPWPQVI